MFIIKHIVFSNYVLNFIDGVVSLSFCEGALLTVQGDVDGRCTQKLLMENLQVVAEERIFLNNFTEQT